MSNSVDMDNLGRDELLLLASSVMEQNSSLASERDHFRSENEKLVLIIKQLQRSRFGRRSEKLDPDQLQFGLEDVEQDRASEDAARDAQSPEAETTPRPARQSRRNRSALPKHLVREDVVVEPEDKACPCCGGALHVIGEDVSEMLDVIPAQFKVKVIRRPRYGCRACEGGVVQASAPARPIDGGMATEALVAHVLVGKYADHLPLYRQAQIFARQGIELDRSTLSDWVGRAAWWLKPLYERLLAGIVASDKIFADDTPVPVARQSG